LILLDLKSFLFGEENFEFLLETALRSFVMFIFILFGLRTLGKRGVTQLSVFELGVIIGLGSAAGDPMFYKDVGLLVGMTVLTVVLALYKFVTYLINRSERIEEVMEGKPTTVIMNGSLEVPAFKEEPIARDELFSQLRMKNVSHLGQVQQAIIETNGEVSAFFFPDDEVRYGLPILPQYHETKQKAIKEPRHYSCTICGNTEQIAPAESHTCKKCDGKEWIASINGRRIT
jgi:uncharacterized membrane protein YcaP (DUF421 family)